MLIIMLAANISAFEGKGMLRLRRADKIIEFCWELDAISFDKEWRLIIFLFISETSQRSVGLVMALCERKNQSCLPIILYF